MRTSVIRLVASAAFLLASWACTDLPTQPVASTPEPAPSYDETVQGCVTDGLCVLPPISGGGCDPWEDLNWCEGDGGACMTSQPGTDDPDFVAITGCPGSGAGPGGGGTPPPGEPPPTEPADTCNTGDPIVDDPDVSQGLASLWVQSNPDANLYQRVERAGWIVEYPAGQFSIMQFTGTEQFGCGQYRNIPLPAQGRVVGFVHTHPYEVGELIVDCNLRNVQTYDGTPSEVDRKSSAALGSFLGLNGPLPGYIIDKDGYYRYDGQSNTATPRRARCGY